MPDTVQAEKMPLGVKVVQFLITLQVALGLVGAAALVGGLAATFEWFILIPLASVTAFAAFLGLLLSRWSSRRKWVRWAVVTMQVLFIAATFWDQYAHAELGWGDVLRDLHSWLIIVLMLLPSTGRWFNEPRR